VSPGRRRRNEGKLCNYVSFRGDNPKYNEQMTPIDNRALYEKYRK
jgi:hypothetical protein